jgi:uncharacterized protein YecE (DUF72 family)
MATRSPPRDEPLRAPALPTGRRIRVGIGGWTYAPWRDNFYPADLPQRRELEHASRHLTAIEVNGTFYGGTRPQHFEAWRDQTPSGFLFSLKGPRAITHRKKLADAGAAIEDFVAAALHLRDRLGPLLWQFDARKRFEPDDLAAFAGLLPDKADGRRLRHVFEMRNPEAVGAEYLALARGREIATVFTDSDEHPSFCDLTSDFVYARLMRSRPKFATGYPAVELKRWAERARQWSDGDEPQDLPRIEPAPQSAKKARDVFVFFIGAAKERNPAAAQALLARLR